LNIGIDGTPLIPLFALDKLMCSKLNDVGSDAPLIDFKWNTGDTGQDKRWTEARNEGAYCQVPNIEDTENGPRQSITCYFPCAKI
jgi:hypothetical protein